MCLCQNGLEGGSKKQQVPQDCIVGVRLENLSQDESDQWSNQSCCRLLDLLLVELSLLALDPLVFWMLMCSRE